MQGFNTIKKAYVAAALVGIVSLIVALSLTGAAEEEQNDNDRASSGYLTLEADAQKNYDVITVYPVSLDTDSIKGQIRVQKGDRITLSISSNINCLFRVAGYGVSEWIGRGSSRDVSFTADKEGAYVYSCGSARSGIIIVE